MKYLIKIVRGSLLQTHSYSQKPNVETRFQLITVPTADNIFLIMDSGARSLMLPTKTVITGPAVSVLVPDFVAFVD